MNTNLVILEGNLTRDPEIKQVGEKSQVANFGLAVSTRKREGGEWKDGDPGFYEIQTWNFVAERVMQLSKGASVIVIGRLQFDRWEKDGEKRTAIRVNADTVGLQLRKAEAKSSGSEDEIPF